MSTTASNRSAAARVSSRLFPRNATHSGRNRSDAPLSRADLASVRVVLRLCAWSFVDVICATATRVVPLEEVAAAMAATRRAKLIPSWPPQFPRLFNSLSDRQKVLEEEPRARGAFDDGRAVTT